METDSEQGRQENKHLLNIVNIQANMLTEV